MSHRAFQAAVGTPFHMAWNSEPVALGAENATPVNAVVDLSIPVNTYDRGEGIVGRGQLLFEEAQLIPYGTKIWIRGERWEYDNARKPEDGNRRVAIVRREPRSTIPSTAPYTGGR